MSSDLEPLPNKGILGNTIVFFVGLSRNWGTTERTIIKDCLLAREAGASVFLYCLKSSSLNSYALEAGIECLYHLGGVKTKVYNWHKMKGLSKVMRELNVNLVHCYEVEILWVLAFFLRANPLVPLVFTPNYELRKFYHHFYYRPLSSRIDQVFLPSFEMVENVWGHLGVPPRKVDFIGLSCEVLDREGGETRPPFRFTEERWYLGTNVAGVEKNTEFFNTLLNAFKILVQKKLKNKSCTLVLACEKAWCEVGFADELKRRVTDMGLGEHVALVGSCKMGEVQTHVDIWVGLGRQEDLEDYTVEAMLNGVPSVFPRNALLMSLLGFAGDVGESYKLGDSRELRKKCEKILLNLETYQTNLHRSNQRLRDQYGEKGYRVRVIGFYQKLLERRQRLLRQRLKGLEAIKR